MSRLRCRATHALALLSLLYLGLAVAPAAAKEFPYTLQPPLSLTGDCSTSAFDPVADPDCPYPAPPEGPSARFNRPGSVAMDAYGNEYVASLGNGTNGRIDIFDDEGHFIGEFADPKEPRSIAVDSKGNLYVFEPASSEREVVRYPPKKYEPKAGQIEYDQATRVVVFKTENFNGGLAVDLSNDHLYVAQNIALREYSSATEGNMLLHTIEPAGSLNQATYVAVDSQRRRLYTEHCKEALSKCGIKVLSADAPYTVLKEIYGYGPNPGEEFLSKQGWLGIAVDEDTGHFFIGDTRETENIYEFDGTTYERVSTFKLPSQIGPLGSNLQMAVANNPLELDPPPANQHYLYVPIPQISGSVLAYALIEGPPKVNGVEATNISEDEAEIGAEVDPNGAETEYAIEYVTDAQFAIDGFASATVAGQGTIPGTSLPQQVSAVIGGLEPGATYHFRVFAENELDTDEEESLFATYTDAPISGTCPNEALRSGYSTGLPDCRAYELVTPPDTGGGTPLGAGTEGDRFGALQASPSGGAISFELQNGAIPGVEATGGYHGDPFASTRSASGWSTHLAGPAGTEATKPQPGSFSPDQGFDFWLADGTGSAMVGGKPSNYVRYPDGRSELVGRGSLGTDPSALGRLITADGAHIIFQTGGKLGSQKKQLEPNAPPTGTIAVYDRTADEVTHVVSLLPGDITPAADSLYLGASPDGEGIAFLNEAKLYLRVGNATTYEIGAGVTFAGVSEGGARIFYLRAGDLHAFDVATEEEIDFTEVGDAVPVNVAPQGTRAYFVSEKEVPGSGQNSEGEEAQTGEQNLYLSEEGEVTFIAIVTDRDVEGEVVAGVGYHLDGLGTWTEALAKRQPATDTSRLNTSGSVFLFQSRANLTGYEPGEFPQVYRYEASSGRLHCLSCPPTRTPATGGATLQSIVFGNSPFSPFGFVPDIAAEGSRVFFESTEALVSGDTDGFRDVYEWEEENVGSCTVPGGCLYLISSGHSDRDDYLFGHSQSGDDVFVSTADVLVGGDEATPSIYDARVGGGFAQVPNVICQGEGCRPNLSPPPWSPPVLLTPHSEEESESGNVTAQPKPKRCPKGKHRVKRAGKKVCVKKKHHRRSAARKGAGR